MSELFQSTRNCVQHDSASIRIPAEWEPHSCCWMAWAVHDEWGAAQNAVKRELSEVIQAISRYEPVRVLAPRGRKIREAMREFSSCTNVTVVEAPVDDIWMRDIGPTFAWRRNERGHEIVAIDWNFKSWGGTAERPPRPGDQLARSAKSVFGVARVTVPFAAEGGALVFDGQGTMITTRSCLLHPSRNPVHSGEDRQRKIESECAKLGIRHVVWLEGDPCEPGTSGHVDGYVLLAPSGKALMDVCNDKSAEPPMWREHDFALLKNATRADGSPFDVVRVKSPRTQYWQGAPETFAPAYLNVYVANGAVIGARFGDTRRDAEVKRGLAKAFPGRDIVMLEINHIADGGGGIHCLTQPMPSIGA